jgi:protein-S-isoprenylcysteine O-methyltransferase Ste14
MVKCNEGPAPVTNIKLFFSTVSLGRLYVKKDKPMTTESIFRVAFWVLIAGIFAMRIFFTLQVRQAGERIMPDRQAVEREGRVMFIVRVVLGLFLFGWLVVYAISPAWIKVLSVPFPHWLRWAGFALGLGSLGFWWWTQIALGKEWSPQLQLRNKHHLVTTGPYNRIRHPLYTAMFGYGLGLALVTANWVFILFALAMIVSIVARVPKEEQMMIEEFEEEYKAYMQRTGRFFPK